MGKFDEKKILFQAKKRQKTRFLGFSHVTALNRFAFLLYCSDDAQIYRVVTQLGVKGVPIIKWTSLMRKKFCFRPKNVKKTLFRAYAARAPAGFGASSKRNFFPHHFAFFINATPCASDWVAIM